MILPSTSIPLQFRLPKSFKFFKCRFGGKGEGGHFEQIGAWNMIGFTMISVKIAAFCYLCMQADHQNKFLSSKKRKPAFMKTGFTYWKEAIFLCANRAHIRLPEPVLSIAILCSESTRFDLRACFFFWGGMPQTPLKGSCFTFWSVLRTLQVIYTYRNINFIFTPFTKHKIRLCYFIGFAWPISSTFLQPWYAYYVALINPRSIFIVIDLETIHTYVASW